MFSHTQRNFNHKLQNMVFYWDYDDRNSACNIEFTRSEPQVAQPTAPEPRAPPGPARRAPPWPAPATCFRTLLP